MLPAEPLTFVSCESESALQYSLLSSFSSGLTHTWEGQVAGGRSAAQQVQLLVVPPDKSMQTRTPACRSLPHAVRDRPEQRPMCVRLKLHLTASWWQAVVVQEMGHGGIGEQAFPLYTHALMLPSLPPPGSRIPPPCSQARGPPLAAPPACWRSTAAACSGPWGQAPAGGVGGEVGGGGG